jgi:hypothetical protein
MVAECRMFKGDVGVLGMSLREPRVQRHTAPMRPRKYTKRPAALGRLAEIDE